MNASANTHELTLEEKYFDALIKQKTPVSIFLRNGIKLTGIVIDTTETSIYLKNVVVQLVYKHAVNTIVPGKTTDDIY